MERDGMFNLGSILTPWRSGKSRHIEGNRGKEAISGGDLLVCSWEERTEHKMKCRIVWSILLRRGDVWVHNSDDDKINSGDSETVERMATMRKKHWREKKKGKWNYGLQEQIPLHRRGARLLSHHSTDVALTLGRKIRSRHRRSARRCDIFRSWPYQLKAIGIIYLMSKSRIPTLYAKNGPNHNSVILDNPFIIYFNQTKNTILCDGLLALLYY